MDKLVESFKPGDNKYTVKYALDNIAQAIRISNSAEAPIETFSRVAQDAIGVTRSLNPPNKLDLATEILAGVTTYPAFVVELENRGESHKLDDLLKDLGQSYSGTMERHLQRLMWSALGHQDRRGLPQNLLTDDYKTDIGRLFGDGKWLLEDVSFGLQPFMDQTMLLAVRFRLSHLSHLSHLSLLPCLPCFSYLSFLPSSPASPDSPVSLASPAYPTNSAVR